MNASQRVFITGLSTVTSLGNTIDENWNGILAGKCGIGPITSWDVSSWEYQLGGELKNFEPSKMLPDRKLLKVISRQDVIGINAAMQAIEHSQLLKYRETLASPQSFNEQTAVYVGSPGNKYYQQYDFLPLLAKTSGNMQAFGSQLFNEVHPMWLLRILPNNVLAYTGITYDLKGINQNITNHAVGGSQAILEAYHAIRQGLAERAVVVGYDNAIEPQAMYYYEKLGVLSARHLKPFDKDHDGTLLGEGASALILESENSAKLRKATCYAEVVGGLSTTEGAGLFSIESEATQLTTLLQQTINHYQLSSQDFNFIVAHGNGNKKSDISEAQAITTVFGENTIPVTAFKWAVGHTICASGILDAAFATKSLYSNSLPGIANLETLDVDCSGLNVVSKTQNITTKPPYAMLIGRGFASMNTCLVIKRCVRS